MKPEHIEQIKALVEAVEKSPNPYNYQYEVEQALPALKAAIASERTLEESDLRKGTSDVE
jgi:hypothetical protein